MRIQTIQKQLENEKMDALLITNAYNRRYMTGFTGTAGVVLITLQEAYFITDFRYVEQANQQLSGYVIIEQERTLIEEVAKLVHRHSLQKVGFEKEAMTYGTYELYKEYMQTELVPTTGLIEKLRIIKTDQEIQILEQAACIADQTFLYIQGVLEPGKTELEIANELEFFMRSKGATSSSFDTIVASGVRSALPHGVATDKVIEAGDFVTLDFGALYQGYVSDITRTVAVGEPSAKLREIYGITLAAQELAIAKIVPGMTGQEADALTRNYIEAHGYGKAFGHSTGHGIGLEVHESPTLSGRSTTQLEPGMTVTVEPGIYLPGIGGVRIEDDIVITEKGNRRLTKSTKDLIIL